MREIVFIVFFCLTVFFGLFSVLHRSVIYNALSLVATIFSVAVIVMMLGYEFIALTLVLIYIGAIAITIVFAVMLTPVKAIPERKVGLGAVLMGIFSALVFFGVIYFVLTRSVFPFSALIHHGRLPEPSMSKLSVALTGKFSLPFEVISVVLVVAIIGVIVIARRRKDVG